MRSRPPHSSLSAPRVLCFAALVVFGQAFAAEPLVFTNALVITAYINLVR